MKNIILFLVKIFCIYIFLIFLFEAIIFPIVYPLFAYSWEELDLNHDGKVTLSEYLHVSNYGKQDIKVGNEICVEYFSLKDANTLKVECPSGYRKVGNQ